MSEKRKPQVEDSLPADSKLGLTGSIYSDSSNSLSDFNSRLDRYAIARSRAVDMAHYIGHLPLGKGRYKSLQSRISGCGEQLVFHHYYTVDQVRLVAAQFCKKHLLCPFCAIRRGSKYLRAYSEKVETVKAENPGLTAYLVTLTIKNGDNLGERFQHLRCALRAMSQARRSYLSNPSKNPYLEFAKAVGGVHSIEFKRGSGSGLWHPHVHMIWFCQPGVAPDQARLCREWEGFTGDSYIVDVRPFHDQADLISGFCEVFKYALKFSDLSLADNWEAFMLLSERRLVDSFGVLRGVKVPDDLTDSMLDLPYIRLFYQYLGTAGYGLSGSDMPGSYRPGICRHAV